MTVVTLAEIDALNYVRFTFRWWKVHVANKDFWQESYDGMMERLDSLAMKLMAESGLDDDYTKGEYPVEVEHGDGQREAGEHPHG